MMIHMVQELASVGAGLGHWSDVLQTVHWTAPHDWVVLAQQFKETDLGTDISKSWNHFVKTGQVWAFLIGIIIGYMMKTFTSYG